jgi:DNA-binding NarL/FixJ family response regulator
MLTQQLAVTPNLKAIHRRHDNEIMPANLNLTTRERQVLEFICLGMKMKEIAKSLFLSESTIISHKRNLLSKFNVNSLVRLAVLAERYKLTIG